METVVGLRPGRILHSVNEQTCKKGTGGLNIVIANVCMQKYMSVRQYYDVYFH